MSAHSTTPATAHATAPATRPVDPWATTVHTGGVLATDQYGPKKGSYTHTRFADMLKEDKFGIQAGSLAAHVYIVKTKASKHFGGTTKDSVEWRPEWEDSGEQSFIAFDNEAQMQEWAEHIIADLYQTVYKANRDVWDQLKKALTPPKDLAAVSYRVTYPMSFFHADSFKAWKYARADGTQIAIQPDHIKEVEVGVIVPEHDPMELYLFHGPVIILK